MLWNIHSATLLLAVCTLPLLFVVVRCSCCAQLKRIEDLQKKNKRYETKVAALQLESYDLKKKKVSGPARSLCMRAPAAGVGLRGPTPCSLKALNCVPPSAA